MIKKMAATSVRAFMRTTQSNVLREFLIEDRFFEKNLKLNGNLTFGLVLKFLDSQECR